MKLATFGFIALAFVGISLIWIEPTIWNFIGEFYFFVQGTAVSGLPENYSSNYGKAYATLAPVYSESYTYSGWFLNFREKSNHPKIQRLFLFQRDRRLTGQRG